MEPEEHMLLDEASHSLVAKELKVPELNAEVERAVRQVKESLLRAEEDRSLGSSKSHEQKHKE